MTWIIAGIAIGSQVVKGIGAEMNKGDVRSGKAAAKDIYEEKLDLLGDVKGTTVGRARDIYGTGMEELGFGTNMELRRTQAFGEQAYSKSGLATSGTIEGKMQTQMKDLMAKYKTTAQKQMDTKMYAEAQADYSFRSGEMTAEEAYESTLTGLESQPQGFFEGLFS